MGKIALWIVVIIVVMLLVRALKPRRGDDAAAGDKRSAGGAGRGGDRAIERLRSTRLWFSAPCAAASTFTSSSGELMMSCAVCGVHLPASDAVFAGGRVYCGPEHRDADLDANRDGKTSDRDAAARGDRE